MTAKEKAIELVNVYLDITKRSLGDEGFFYDIDLAKECALIAVDELIYSHSQDTTDNQFYYWQEVKQEIELL